MTDTTLQALSACVRLCRKQLERQTVAQTMTNTEIVACGALATPWVAGAYSLGAIRQHEGVVYRCYQAHDSTDNPSWSPDAVPALWVQYHTTDPARATPYVAPTGAHDVYNAEECMVYTDGVTYRCLVDGAVHDPVALPSAWEVASFV